MKVFHGCAGWEVEKLLAANGDFIHTRWPGLFVTDTFERAARYANARATGIVSADFQDLATHAAVVEIETSDQVIWHTRPAGHPSLDQCEAIIDTGIVVHITHERCDYRMCACQTTGYPE